MENSTNSGRKRKPSRQNASQVPSSLSERHGHDEPASISRAPEMRRRGALRLCHAATLLAERNDPAAVR